MESIKSPSSRLPSGISNPAPQSPTPSRRSSLASVASSDMYLSDGPDVCAKSPSRFQATGQSLVAALKTTRQVAVGTVAAIGVVGALAVTVASAALGACIGIAAGIVFALFDESPVHCLIENALTGAFLYASMPYGVAAQLSTACGPLKLTANLNAIYKKAGRAIDEAFD